MRRLAIFSCDEVSFVATRGNGKISFKHAGLVLIYFPVCTVVAFSTVN